MEPKPNYLISTERSKILSESNFKNIAQQKISSAKKYIKVISAYIKKNGISWLHEQLPNNVECEIYAKFSPIDLITGASDLDCFLQIKEYNWKLFINNDLHSKVIIIDSEYVLLGSQNLTSRGYGIAVNPNLETGVLLKCDLQELERLNKIFNSSVLLNDEIYKELKIWVEKNKIDKKIISYPASIQEKLITNLDNIQVLDFPQLDFQEFISSSNGNEESNSHFKELLNIVSLEQFSENTDQLIKGLKIYKWIINELNKTQNKELYFGTLSSLVHDALIDDPKPYRKSVKELQKNLYSYLEVIKDKEIFFDQPNHSVRMYLKS